MKNPSITDRLIVCRQIATLIESNRPIVGELTQSFDNLRRSSAKDFAADVERRIAQGQQLADALHVEDNLEDRCLTASVHAGESSGNLGATLRCWINLLQDTQRYQQRLRNALLYPILLLVVTIVSLSSVIWLLVPQYQSTYVMLDQDIPFWLEAIVWLRVRFGFTVVLLVLGLVLPVAVWQWRQRGRDANGQPRDPALRDRVQAFVADLVAQMLNGKVPLRKILSHIGRLTAKSDEFSEEAFARIQSQQLVPDLAEETSLLLNALHAGLLPVAEVESDLRQLAIQLRKTANAAAMHRARWLPMQIALVVGFVIVATYVFLIYLPWIWMLQKIVEPGL